MRENTKNIIVIIEFILILFIIFIANIIKKDENISIAERRKMAQFPEVTINTILSGKASEDFEKYAIDQFTERDLFRKIKYLFNTKIFMQQDNNKLFVKGDSIYKMDYPLNENAIISSAKKIETIYEKNLQGMKVYYSIIPDKNHYLEDKHLKMDTKKIEKLLKENLNNMIYIDITKELEKEDFYKTDLHWKQENIVKVSKKIKENMKIEEASKLQYEIKKIGDFYGGYYGQVGTKVTPDELIYLTNETIENCITYNYETKKQSKIYDLEKYNTSQDKYDIFVSGATPLIEIYNPNMQNKKELILFRDSFGSSLAPLLIEDYSKITLVDLRYMPSDLLEQYITFEKQDVLFIYSTTVLNQNILR